MSPSTTSPTGDDPSPGQDRPAYARRVIVSTGTRVVLTVPVASARGVIPEGAVAVVVHAPADDTHDYRVRLPDGHETGVSRQEFSRLVDVQSPQPPAPLDDHELRESVIYRCVVGSRAYGLDHGESDFDRRGIYLPPAHRHWSLFGVPEQLEDKSRDECYWELQKFLVLAAKANPNILECLWTPLVEHAGPVARELLDRRDMFLSQLVYQTFNGYTISQFRKLEVRRRQGREPKRKHAMHLIRLLLAGSVALREGRILVDVGAHRDELLAIRDGRTSWDEIDRRRRELHAAMDDAFERTALPQRPDYAAIDDLLVRARRSAL